MEFNCENCGWSKVVGSPIFCEYSEKRTFRENCCEAWKPKNNPVTNADRIRAMSDEELAKFLLNRDLDGVEKASKAVGFTYKVDREQCLVDVIDWLKQEVSDDQR